MLDFSIWSPRSADCTPPRASRVDLPWADQPHSRVGPAPSKSGALGGQRTRLLKRSEGRINWESNKAFQGTKWLKGWCRILLRDTGSEQAQALQAAAAAAAARLTHAAAGAAEAPPPAAGLRRARQRPRPLNACAGGVPAARHQQSIRERRVVDATCSGS